MPTSEEFNGSGATSLRPSVESEPKNVTAASRIAAETVGYSA